MGAVAGFLSSADNIFKVFQLAGTAFSAVSSYQSRQAQADAEADRTRAEHERLKREQARNIARHKAQIGASGVTAEGTPLLILEEQAYEDALDSQALLKGGKAREREIRQKGLAESVGYGMSAAKQAKTLLG